AKGRGEQTPLVRGTSGVNDDGAERRVRKAVGGGRPVLSIIKGETHTAAALVPVAAQDDVSIGNVVDIGKSPPDFPGDIGVKTQLVTGVVPGQILDAPAPR